MTEIKAGRAFVRRPKTGRFLEAEDAAEKVDADTRFKIKVAILPGLLANEHLWQRLISEHPRRWEVSEHECRTRAIECMTSMAGEIVDRLLYEHEIRKQDDAYMARLREERDDAHIPGQHTG